MRRRRQTGAEVVSRQSNLIVESTRQVPDARLREMLIAEIRRQNKPYGLYFQNITGGYTTTGRGGLQAFKVIPLVVYRVYPDGRPDELVRGRSRHDALREAILQVGGALVASAGTVIVGLGMLYFSSFAKILATSNHQEVFNGYCGAESGSVPVSAVSPALLVSEIEIEKETEIGRPPAVASTACIWGG